jgi:hypothetical protein
MAVTKFVRAQDILKEKGFKASPFDTAGFQNAVVEFFQKNDVSAKLDIISERFIDCEGAPACGFAASTETIDDEDWGLVYVIPSFLDWHYKYCTFPFFVVDEPYVTNAVALLKMAGFIVSRKHKHKRLRWLDSYTVTLV